MHAEAIARELGVAEVIIPEFPGAFSAWGMLGSDVRRDLSAQYYVHEDQLERADLARVLSELVAAADAELEAQGVPVERRRFEQAIDMRYEGQDYTLTVPLTDAGEPGLSDFAERISARYSEQHRRRYGHATPEAKVEFVSVRVTGLGANEFGHLTGERYSEDDIAARSASVWFDGRAWDTPIRRRDSLPIGDTVAGPLLIVEDTTTTVVSPRASVRRETLGHLTMEVQA